MTVLGTTYLLVRKITSDLIGVLKAQTLSIERMTHSIVAEKASRTATSMTGPAILQQVSKINEGEASAGATAVAPPKDRRGGVTIRTEVP